MMVRWREAGEERSARWLSASRERPPRRIVVADDTLPADTAFRLAAQGTGILWRGDFQNARQLLDAMTRRADRSGAKRGGSPERSPEPAQEGSPAEAFHRYRMQAAQRAHTLGMLLVELEPDRSIPLRRAPDVRGAVTEAFGPAGGPADGPAVIPLRELLGAIGAHEWRKKGVEVAALGARIHPHYGVFAPVRQEYVDLVAEAPLPAGDLAFDIGTGTGVLAAVLARRGLARVVATDNEPRAVACARDNLQRLGLADRVEVVEADLFPPEPFPRRASLVVCNPPWLPARAMTPLERAVYDPGGRMLRAFLAGLPHHLAPGGVGWLVLSDLAEQLGLRSRDELLDAFEAAGLSVLGRLETRPTHDRPTDEADPLHAYRRVETTSLWRLAPA